MTLRLSKPFLKQYAKLPLSIRRKVDRQVRALTTSFRHPSLHTKRIKGSQAIWEARVDYQHRFTFVIDKDRIILRTVGPHDILKQP